MTPATSIPNYGIFREYDIRGVADRDLTPPAADAVAHAIALYFLEKGARHVALGRDCRVSSPRLHASLLSASTSSGLDVLDIGICATPMLYFAVQHRERDGGVMITGSHNPAEHNGFKIALGKATIYGDEIQRIAALAQLGTRKTDKGSVTNTDVSDEYVRRICDEVGPRLGSHKRPKIVVDSGNGVGAIAGPRIYRELGCEVVSLYDELDGRFPNHHPDPTVPANLAALREAVHAEGAAFGIAFDGDADRIGVVDGSGRVLFGDELLAIYARALLKKKPGATVISEVKASHRLFEDVARHGGKPIMWKTGHSLIKAKMTEVHAELAGEMSGHMFFKDTWYGFDDAIYAGARLIEIVATTGQRPAELIADLPPGFATPEIRVDCADDIKFRVVQRATESFQKQGLTVNPIDGARVEFADGWGLVRASNTQPVLVFRFEATTEKRLGEIRAQMEKTVADALRDTAE